MLSIISVSLLDWIQAVQALMILSLLFCFFSLIAFLYQLFRLVKGGRFFFTAIFQIFASEYDFIARWRVTPWTDAGAVVISSAFTSHSPHLSSRLSQVCLWCVGRSSTLWWVRMIIPTHISATLTCLPGWLSLSVSSVASFISSWERKNERRSKGEKRRGRKKTPYHNIALCLLPTDHRLTSQLYNKSACVTNYCKHKKETFITAGDLSVFFCCCISVPIMLPSHAEKQHTYFFCGF